MRIVHITNCIGLSFLIVLSAAAQVSNTSSIIRLDPAVDTIVSADARLEKLPDSRGPGVREGPVWINGSDYLLYSDMNARTINKWRPGDAQISVFQRDVNVIGITVDPQGRIVWGGWSDDGGEIVRLEKNNQRTILARGEPLKSPNDLIFKSDGSLYFTDHGRHLQPQDSHSNNPNPSVYLLKDGKPSVLIHSPMPNGLALSPDEKYLYIDDSIRRTVTRYEINADGTINNGKLIIDQNEGQEPCPWRCEAGFPDGLKVDLLGNIYSTGPGGIWIMSPDGKHIGTLRIPNHPSNLCFGGSDGKTLYVTSRPGLYRIHLKIPGIRPQIMKSK